MRKKPKRKNVTMYPVKMKSLLDLAKTACTLSRAPIIFAIKEKGTYKLMLPGEKVDDSSNLYTFETDSLANFCLYSPIGGAERLEFRNELGPDTSDYKTYRIQIMELLNTPFSWRSPGSKEPILIFRVKDYEALIKGILSGMGENERMGRVYRFEYNNNHYLCSFGNTYEGNVMIFYAKIDPANLFNFISYNYSSNKLEFLKSLENAAYASIAVVNLAEPFPFFKPE